MGSRIKVKMFIIGNLHVRSAPPGDPEKAKRESCHTSRGMKSFYHDPTPGCQFLCGSRDEKPHKEEIIMAIQVKLDESIKCPICGSEWFSEITYHRYSACGYSSLEFWTIEAMPQRLRVCLCGRPFKRSQQLRAGFTPNAELRSFSESMELAEKQQHGGGRASQELRLMAHQ